MRTMRNLGEQPWPHGGPSTSNALLAYVLVFKTSVESVHPFSVGWEEGWWWGGDRSCSIWYNLLRDNCVDLPSSPSTLTSSPQLTHSAALSLLSCSKKTQFPRKSFFASMAFSSHLFVWDYMRNAVITWLWTLRGEKNFNIMFTIITVMCAIRYGDECWFFRPISISSTIWKKNVWWLFRVKLSTLSNSEFV